MSDFGLEIFPEIGGHFAFNGNTTILNYAGSGSRTVYPSSAPKENGVRYVDLYHPTPPNSNVILMHNSAAGISYGVGKNPVTGKTQWYPRWLEYTIDYKKIDDNTIRFYYYYTYYEHKFDYSVFYYLNDTASSVDFGMKIGKSDGFYNIGNTSTPLPLIHSEIFNFNGTYTPPVAEPAKTISFFSWSDPDLTLIPAPFVTYSSESLFGTYRGYDRNGNLWNRNTQMKVCTFGTSNQTSLYGIDIYNGSGRKVFNSKYGVLKNIRTTKLQNSEYSYTNLGITPMVCPASVGGRYLQTGRYENGDEIDFGINMYGTKISAGYTRRKYQAASHGALTAVAPIDVFYINHDDYF